MLPTVIWALRTTGLTPLSEPSGVLKVKNTEILLNLSSVAVPLARPCMLIENKTPLAPAPCVPSALYIITPPAALFSTVPGCGVKNAPGVMDAALASRIAWS